LFPQGRLLRRGKIAKNASVGIFYTWKDLNIGVDIELGGIVYHVADCDAYTREFLTANGIEVNQRECMPKDPYAIDKLVKIYSFYLIGHYKMCFFLE
jgi:EF-hand domain-containing protein 1